MEMRLVCHKWDDVIIGDPNMKRLMFLKAGSGGIHDQRQDNVTEVWCVGSSKDRVKSAAPVLWNPLLFGNHQRVPYPLREHRSHHRFQEIQLASLETLSWTCLSLSHLSLER